MTKNELAGAVELSRKRQGIPFPVTNLHRFNGFSLPSFEPIVCTLADIADLIRWQCSMVFGGGMDIVALQEIADIGRRKFQVVG